MSHLKYAFAWTTLATILFYSAPRADTPPPSSGADEIDLPARPVSLTSRNQTTDPARVQRKPAVEPRVYVESADSPSGFVYFDYPDQAQANPPQHQPDSYR